jgi:DNA-binding HxlR family transcriptional regulator
MGRMTRPSWLRSSPSPRLTEQAGPLERSLNALGRKRTLLILRDLAFRRISRFNELLRNNPGPTPRVLSRRLREMQAEELILRLGTGRDVRYAITPRGKDAVYVFLAFLKYGLQRHRGATTGGAAPRGTTGLQGSKPVWVWTHAFGQRRRPMTGSTVESAVSPSL